MRIYQDSKELTATVYGRIEATNDYRFMIKGYQYGDEVECNIDDLEAKFKEIVQDYVIQLNNKSLNFEQIGIMQKANNDYNLYSQLLSIIDLQIQINELSLKVNIEPKDILTDAMSVIKIQRNKDLEKQKEIVLQRLKKIENDAIIASNKIDKNDKTTENEKTPIEAIVAMLSVALGISIDMDKTSIFQIGIYIELSNKRNESIENGRK